MPIHSTYKAHFSYVTHYLLLNSKQLNYALKRKNGLNNLWQNTMQVRVGGGRGGGMPFYICQVVPVGTQVKIVLKHYLALVILVWFWITFHESWSQMLEDIMIRCLCSFCKGNDRVLRIKKRKGCTETSWLKMSRQNKLVSWAPVFDSLDFWF